MATNLGRQIWLVLGICCRLHLLRFFFHVVVKSSFSSLQGCYSALASELSMSLEGEAESTVLCAKRVESALFNSLVILSDKLHAIRKPNIST